MEPNANPANWAQKIFESIKTSILRRIKIWLWISSIIEINDHQNTQGIRCWEKRCRKIRFGYLQAQDWPVYANPASSYFFHGNLLLVHEVFRLFQNFFLGGFRLSWSFKFARHKWELQPWKFESDITRASISVLWCSSKHFNKTGKMSDERWAPFRAYNL